ncbi:MAG: hypothetical protein IJF15_04440 [Oscillospiraceae bacterium]|nr:hypothetical protein [Oscillospiraceae bacterium]
MFDFPEKTLEPTADEAAPVDTTGRPERKPMDEDIEIALRMLRGIMRGDDVDA